MLMRTCSRLWCYFTTPIINLVDLEQYRQAKLLAVILGILISLGLFSWFLQILFYSFNTVPPSYIFFVVLLLFVAHALNRQGIYTSAAILTAMVPSLVCFLVIMENPSDVFGYFYLLVGIFLSSVLLTMRIVVFIAVANVFAAMFLLQWSAESIAVKNQIAVFIFLIFVGGLLLLGMRYRDNLDKDRLNMLADNQQCLAKAQEIAQVGSWTWNLATNKVTWSDQLYRIYGLSPQVIDIDVWDIIEKYTHPADLDNVRQAAKDAISHHKPIRIEYRIVRSDGDERILWGEGDFLPSDGQKSINYIGIIRDITEQKQIESTLRQSEEKWLVITENSADVIMMVDKEGKILCINHTLPEHTKETVVGVTLYSFLPEELHARLKQCFDSVIATGQSSTFEVDFPDPEGNYRCYESSVSTLRDKGMVDAFVVSARDVTERKLAEDKIRESEKELSGILGSMRDTYYRTNREGLLTRVSASVQQLLGYTPEQMSGAKAADFYVNSADNEAFEILLKAQNGTVLNYELPLKHKDGHHVWVLTNAQYYFDKNNNIAGVEGTTRDVTERKQTELQMGKLSRALEQTADAVLITDRQGIIEYVNPSFVCTTGFTKQEAIGKKTSILKSGEQSDEFYSGLWKTILNGEAFNDVFVNKKKDGTIYHEQKTITPLKDSHGEITHFVATGKDITERMQTQQRLQFLAHHDVLTELPNRALYLDRLEQAITRAPWHGRLVAALFIDLDRFKNINDTLGHEVGDRLLQELGCRLLLSIREGDTVARFGGDEFAILLDDIASEKDVSGVAQKILDTLSPPFVIDGRDLYVTASIGISLYPNDGNQPGILLRNADIAMYRAKDLGKNNCQFYSADLSARAFERLTLENSLRHALEREEFVLYYQPQLNTEQGKITGVEALIRWHHPEFGVIKPHDFIFLLEETGLIVPVGEWVLLTACKQLKKWHLAGFTDLHVSVNFSSRQCDERSIVDVVERALLMGGIAPEFLELEITESLLMRNARSVVDALEQLSRMGVRLAIDDFGTGYSSLSYLKRFPIDTLKIDRSFVRDIATDPDDVAIVKAIIAMGKTLKLRVVAEGVETTEQWNFLKQKNCDVVQGYLLNEPMIAGSLEEWLKSFSFEEV